MLKPILIGSLFCAVAETTNIAQAATANTVPASHADVRDLSLCNMFSPPMKSCFISIANHDSARRNGPPACGCECPKNHAVACAQLSNVRGASNCAASRSIAFAVGKSGKGYCRAFSYG